MKCTLKFQQAVLAHCSRHHPLNKRCLKCPPRVGRGLGTRGQSRHSPCPGGAHGGHGKEEASEPAVKESSGCHAAEGPRFLSQLSFLQLGP